MYRENQSTLRVKVIMYWVISVASLVLQFCFLGALLYLVFYLKSLHLDQIDFHAIVVTLNKLKDIDVDALAKLVQKLEHLDFKELQAVLKFLAHYFKIG